MFPHDGSRFKRGFTLIEVLIALALSVMLAGILFSALHTYVLSAAAGQAHVAARQLSESVSQFIRDQLREAVPLMLNARGKRQIFFYGDERKIVYVGTIPRHRSAGGLHRNSLTIGGDPPNQTLSFTYERLALDDVSDFGAFAGVDTSKARILVEAAPSIGFEYFGASSSSTDARWFAKWPVDDRLPELIRIRIEKANDPSSPDIVVPVYANKATNQVALSIGQRTTPTLSDLVPGLSGAREQRAADAIGKAPRQ